MAESSAYYNPWAEEDSSLGCLRSVLQLAERTGHIKGRPDDAEILASAADRYKSVKHISLLKSVQQRRDEIYKVNLDIQNLLQNKETKDLTNIQVLERRRDTVSSMSNHIQRLVGCKDSLISRLQQPYVGDFFKLDANYHQYMAEVLPEIAPLLAELASHLDNLDWASQEHVNDQQLETLLSDMSSALAILQSNLQCLHSLQSSTSLLHGQLTSSK